MKVILVGIFSILVSLRPATDNRYALLIGIGTYPVATGVEPLHAQNDLRLMRQTLQKQGFQPTNILTLLDQQATRRAIETHLDSLARTLPTSSKLVVLFSGHCLQIPDDNRDETDQLDEALLPYDGKPTQPATLLRDDQLGTYLARLRARIGPNGHVLFLFDSCHSGSLLRQGIDRGQTGRGVGAAQPTSLPVPDTSGWFDLANPTNQRLGRYVLLAATADGQPSFECTDTNGVAYGPLTLAVCRAWQQMKPPTYLAFFEQVRGHMATLAPYQAPTLEGDRHAPFLGR